MRDCLPKQEEHFFELVSLFYNLEATPTRAYSEEEYSLARMAPLVALAGHPERRLKVIHIAGTKGKGTTCFFLSSLLQSAGKTVGVFSSPHVATVRERFLINGELVSYDFLLKETEELCQKILTQTTLKPSLFELMTILACLLFEKSGCEYAILETGIGGTLDATNYVEKPIACGISSVSFDHQELLGKTIEEIATQKAGIIKTAVPIVCAIQPFKQAEKIISQVATTQQAPLTTIKKEQVNTLIMNYLTPDFPIFLQENFATARAICQLLKVEPNPAHFHCPSLRARFEVIQEDPPVILDAAHNRNSADRLTEALQQRFPKTTFTIILGIVPGKDYQGIIDELQPVIHRIILTDPKTTKGSRAEEIKAYLTKKEIDFIYLPHLTKEDIPRTVPILFTGSFYTAVIGDELYF